MRNESGIQPLEYKCLVQMPSGEEVSKGGIIIPKSVSDREKKGSEEAIFVEAGALAFRDPDWVITPGKGQKVLIDKYAGSLRTGRDGKEYRIINDKEICAIMEE